MKKALIALVMVLALIFATTGSYAEKESGLKEAWVLCQPDSYINIRTNPKKNSEVSGYLLSGDKILTDGKQRNGYLHILGYTENGEGWVSKGYVVYSEAVQDGNQYKIDAKGRVACRRSVNGTRRRWLLNGDILTVYMVSDEWCLTSEGFVKTEFIDFSGKDETND